MPVLFHTLDGKLWELRQSVPLILADGTSVRGIWDGYAELENRSGWCDLPGNELAQSELIPEIAIKSDSTKEIRWGAAPPGARLIFNLEPPKVAKTGEHYRLARMVTTTATPAQVAYFQHARFALFGRLRLDGHIDTIPPLSPPLPAPPQYSDQGQLF
jgi:hypothetical protein